MKDLLSEQFEVEMFRWNLSWYLTDSGSLFDKIKYYTVALLKYAIIFIRTWSKFVLKQPDALYIVPSSNIKGILRDFILYLPYLISNRRIFCQIRSGSFIINTKLLKFIYGRKNFRFLFLTPYLSQISNTPRDQKIVIPNLVDPTFDLYQPNLKSNNSDTIKIVFLSNLFASKGVLNIIEAVKKCKYSKNYRLYIYGKGESAIVERITKSIKNYENIIYNGEVSDRKQVKLIYSGSDIFALPTVYSVEASPRSIIEAMSQSCVPLVTNHAGIPDMVNSQCSYIIDKNRDITRQLIDNLDLIYLNRADLKLKQTLARERYETQFGRKQIQGNILEFFSSSIN